MFVKAKQILHSILITNEYLDSMIKSSEPGVFCKLDSTNAYHHVNWEFLLYLLKRRDFGENWCTWIGHCISSVHFFVLVNGTPSKVFKSSYGLR